MLAEKTLVLGGIEGKQLDILATTLVNDVPTEQHKDLFYVLQKALLLLTELDNDQS